MKEITNGNVFEHKCNKEKLEEVRNAKVIFKVKKIFTEFDF